MSIPDLIKKALEASGRELLIDQSDAAISELTKKIVEWGEANGVSGMEHYWPARYADLTKEERDAAIRKEFNGQNLAMVCKKYGVSHMTVYRAVRNQ